MEMNGIPVERVHDIMSVLGYVADHPNPTTQALEIVVRRGIEAMKSHKASDQPNQVEVFGDAVQKAIKRAKPLYGSEYASSEMAKLEREYNKHKV